MNLQATVSDIDVGRNLTNCLFRTDLVWMGVIQRLRKGTTGPLIWY